ncbi:MAG: hypothetical protein M3Z24_04410 [Chloroflexota bacterium]|nr:hypothetical protein [Chloroflexota bacterium]
MPIATDPLSLVFIACFLFGFLFLIVTALLGNLGHGHASTHHGSVHIGGHGGVSHTIGHAQGHTGHTGHTGHAVGNQAQGQQTANSNQEQFLSTLSYLNPTSVVLFLLGFGLLGYVFHNTTRFMLPLTLVMAGIGGILIAALLLWFIGRIFGDSEGATVQDVSDRTGLLGKVSTTIQENSLGEITYTSPGGMRKSIPARSLHGERLERGLEVVVVNYQRGVAEVETWDKFIQEEETSFAPSSGTDELEKLRTLLEESEGTSNPELVIRKDTQKE